MVVVSRAHSAHPAHAPTPPMHAACCNTHTHTHTSCVSDAHDAHARAPPATGVFGSDAMDTGIPVEVWRYYLLANRPEASVRCFGGAQPHARVPCRAVPCRDCLAVAAPFGSRSRQACAAESCTALTACAAVVALLHCCTAGHGLQVG
jgi:hypothetical protein